MGSFRAISTRICFWTSGLSSNSYLCLSEYDSWNCSSKDTAHITKELQLVQRAHFRACYTFLHGDEGGVKMDFQ